MVYNVYVLTVYVCDATIAIGLKIITDKTRFSIAPNHFQKRKKKERKKLRYAMVTFSSAAMHHGWKMSRCSIVTISSSAIISQTTGST